jgi:hypothetical protein
MAHRCSRGRSAGSGDSRSVIRCAESALSAIPYLLRVPVRMQRPAAIPRPTSARLIPIRIQLY